MGRSAKKDSVGRVIRGTDLRSGRTGSKYPGGSRFSSRARSEKLGRAVIATLVTCLLLGPFTFTGSAQANCASPPTQEWVSLTPGFTSGSDNIIDYSVAPNDPKIIYVANDQTVRLSTDGGCSFREIFNVATAGLSYNVEHASIRALEISWTPESAFVALEAFQLEAPNELPVVGELPGPVADEYALPRPHVVSSSDRGATWTEVDRGLEDALGPPLMLSAGGGGQDVYLLTGRAEIEQQNTAIFTAQRLYGSSDGGSTWSLRQEFGDNGAGQETPAVPVDGVEADPDVAGEVWSYGKNQQGLWRSTDGGATFNPNASTATASMGGLSIGRVGDTVSCVTFAASVATLLLGDCNVFYPFDIAAIATSAVQDPASGQFGFSDAQGAVHWVIPGVINPIDISSPDRSITDLVGSFEGKTEAIYGRTLRTLERRAAPPPPPPEIIDLYEPTEPLPPIPPDIAADLAELEKPRMLPEEVHMALQPGESETVTFNLQLPGVRKVDIAFLIDMSESMRGEIQGLLTGIGYIVNELAKADVHAHFGVAGYRTYAAEPAYRRYLDISAPGDELEDALGEMTAENGANDDETATSALYEIAMGEGQDEPGAFISSGYPMNFRPDAQRLVIHGTDEALSEVPPRKTIAEAATALLSVRAQHAGLAFLNTEANPVLNGPPLLSLQEMSRATNSFAPPSGIDCGGGDLVPMGAPLVCEIPDNESELSANMAGAIVEIVKNLEDRRDVSLEVLGDPADAEQVDASIAPLRYPQIDFKVIHQLPFEVTVTCPSGTGDYEIPLGAMTRGTAIAESVLTVECRDVPAAAEESTVANVPPFLPPPLRPPQLNNPYQYSQNPVTQAQAQTQAQSQAQAQAGLVHQKQEQPQVATVQTRTSTAERTASSGSGSEDMMMARFTPRKKPGFPLYVYVGGYAVAGAMGLAFMIATRTSRVPIRVRRRFR